MKDFLEKIYEENSYFKELLNEWARDTVYYDDYEDCSFIEKYNLIKKWVKYGSLKKDFIKIKELELQTIIKNSKKHKIILNNFKNRVKYSKRQKELYDILVKMCNELNNLQIKEQYYITEWRNFGKEIKFEWIDNETGEKKVENRCINNYRFINNTIEINFSNISSDFVIFKRLIQKLENNQEEEILSHFFIKRYKYDQACEFVPLTEIEIENWRTNIGEILVIV